MTFNNVITCGCSFLYGIGCYTKKNTLGRLMARKLNARYTELSVPGGSNDRIIRKTIDWAMANKNQLKNTFFLIGITDIGRYESWDELLQGYGQGSVQSARGPHKDDEPYEHHHIDYPHARGSELDLYRETDGQLLAKVQRMYYKYLHSNKSDLNRVLRNIILLTSFFEKHGSKYIIFNSIGDLKQMAKGITFRQRSLAKGHGYADEVFNNKNYYSEESWYESISPRGKGLFAAEDERFGDSNDWGHPNEKAHKLWFEKLVKHGEEIGLWKE